MKRYQYLLWASIAVLAACLATIVAMRVLYDGVWEFAQRAKADYVDVPSATATSFVMDEIPEETLAPTPPPIESEYPTMNVEIVTFPEYWVADNVRVTAYCSCEICCGKWALDRPVDDLGNEIVFGATGARLTPRRSVAVNPHFIPYGAFVYIQDRRTGVWHEYVAEDNSPTMDHIDIYYEDHDTAWYSGYGENDYTIYWSIEPLDIQLILDGAG